MRRTITRIALFFAIVLSSFRAYSQNYIDFGFYPDQYCEPAQLTMYDYSSISVFQGALDYKWYIDEILVATDPYPPVLPLNKGHHNIRLEIRDTVSLLGTRTYSIDINGKITDFLVSTGLQVCPGQEINFGIDNVYSASWDFGYSNYFTSSTSSNYYTSFTYDKPGNYNVTLIVDNYCSGVDTVVKTITVSNTAKPSLLATDVMVQSGCVNDPVKFSTNNIYSTYLWDFGDGMTSNLASPVHTYKSSVANVYPAKLTVTNQCGGSTFVNFPVSINTGVPADATFSSNPLLPEGTCQGAPIQFVPNGSGNFIWDFGDGTTSTERSPVHRFGNYGNVSVTLTVTNGCKNTVTNTQDIYIYDYSESYIPYPFFTFDVPMNGQGPADTLTVCPDEKVVFDNQTGVEAGINYSWDFGDGSVSYGYNSYHKYSSSGLYTVTLKAFNSCGSYQIAQKYVNVNPGNYPVIAAKAIPAVICAGDKAYFIDDNFDSRNNYVYSINFGDGNSVNNISKETDKYLPSLATHPYANGGPYNYTITATNVCGNSAVANGTITVDNNPLRKPFIYVDNSTQGFGNQDPADWSVRHSPTDFEVDIPVQWSVWTPAYGNDFYVYLYYGTFEPMMLDGYGNPNGFVHFTSADLSIGTTVKAFVPVDQMGNTTVGMAAVYFCGGAMKLGERPDATGQLFVNGVAPVPSIPIIPSGYTDLYSQNMGIYLDSYYNGVCKASSIENTWYRMVEPGVYAFMYLYDTGDGLAYELSYRDGVESFTKNNIFQTGYYYKNSTNDTLTFYSYNGCSFDGLYKVSKPDDNTLGLTSFNELCTDRMAFLNGVFSKYSWNPATSFAACPGDKVQFKAAGGNSYQWNFGDAATSTSQYPTHVYAAPGTYNARVIITTNCTNDTAYTKVTIMNKIPEQVYFYAPQFEKFAGDSVHFSVQTYDENVIDNHSYLWDFGDGTTSNLKNPAHVYKTAGDYKVSLTATNSCGPAISSELITIMPKYSLCEAKFNYWFDGPVGFENYSIGNPTAWSWDFGDGTYSTEQSPTHYYDKDGYYTVTLTIYNEQSNCFSSVTKNVVAGWFACNADFTSQINTSSGEASFQSTSQSATDYYWDFGDGKFSKDPNPVHTYAKTGVYKVCLTIWDNQNACQSSICKDVLFIPTGVSYMKADYAFFVDPVSLTVSFNDLSSPNATSWYWKMGDGKYLTGKNPVYTYNKPGIYEVCLTATDKINNVSKTICKKLRVGDVACATGTNFSYFINPDLNEVSFFSTTNGLVDSYFWNFGDGQSSTLQNPVYQYLKPGNYKVTLSVRNSVDGCSDKFTKIIPVGISECAAGFIADVDPTNNFVKFHNDSKGTIDYYYWEFGDGSFSVTEDPDHLYKNAGQYKVGQTVIDYANSCVDYIAQPLQVGEIGCAADFITYIDEASYTAYFTNQVLGESTVLFWSFGDGKYSTEQNPVHEFPSAGFYSAGLNTFNSINGCMDYYQEKLLIGNIGSDCDADFIFRVDPLTNDVTFKDKSTGDIVDYLWNFGDLTDNSTEQDPVHHFDKPGYYYVCQNVVNSEGIKNMGCKWVYVGATNSGNCAANFMFTVDSLNLKAKFVDKSLGDITDYWWNFGDSSPDSSSRLKNPEHTFAKKGYYLVRLRVDNTNTGCYSDAFKLLNVGESQVLKASFGYYAKDPDKKLAGYPVDLVSASSGDGATVEWDFGDKNLKGSFTVMDSTSGIVTHYYQLPGKYLVCIRITDPISDQTDEYCQMIRTQFGVGINEDSFTDLSLEVYPNPFVDFTTINYVLPKSEFIEIAIFDQLGRKIETLVQANREPGEYKTVWQTKTLSPGIYHLKLKTGDEILTRQLVITK